jgi:hypothetical protein
MIYRESKKDDLTGSGMAELQRLIPTIRYPEFGWETVPIETVPIKEGRFKAIGVYEVGEAIIAMGLVNVGEDENWFYYQS